MTGQESLLEARREDFEFVRSFIAAYRPIGLPVGSNADDALDRLERHSNRLAGEMQLLTDAFARVVAWIRDPEAMESEAEMAEIADAALFRAEGVLDRGE